MGAWEEKLKQALIEINRLYADGCVSFFEKQQLNEWQAEHDALEAMINLGGDTDIKNAIDVFEANCKKLLSRYKK